MSMFSITSGVVSVDAAFLKHPVQLTLVDVDGVAGQCFRCVGSNTSLHRLLVTQQYAKHHGSAAVALRKTDILKTLKQLKDDEWTKALEAMDYNPEIRRYTPPGMRTKVCRFPATVDIVAPQVLHVEGMTMTVELTKPQSGVVMLLTPEVLEYLRSVVSAQLDSGGCPAIAHVRTSMGVADCVDTNVENLYWSYNKKKHRAVFFPLDEDGKKKPRTECITGCREIAMTFVKSGVRPPRRRNTVVVGVGDDDTPAEPSEADIEDEASSSGNVERSSASIEAREDGGSQSDVV